MSLDRETPKRTRAEINRENAQKSTGPKTPEGKAVSCLNAFRHGLTAQTALMPDEDSVAYMAFMKTWVTDLKPEGAKESYLAQFIGDASWRLNRASAMEHNVLALAFQDRETKIITSHPEAHAALATADGLRKKLPSLQHLSMHQQRVYKQIQSALRELEHFQTTRKAQEENDLEIAANLMQMHEEANPGPGAPPYDPAEDGFVFHVSAIATFITRQIRRRKALKYGDVRVGAA